MADDVVLPGTGDTVAADEIGGKKFQRIKLIHGADGVNEGDVAGDNPLPVSVQVELLEAIEAMRIAFVGLAAL